MSDRALQELPNGMFVHSIRQIWTKLWIKLTYNEMKVQVKLKASTFNDQSETDFIGKLAADWLDETRLSAGHA